MTSGGSGCTQDDLRAHTSHHIDDAARRLRRLVRGSSTGSPADSRPRALSYPGATMGFMSSDRGAQPVERLDALFGELAGLAGRACTIDGRIVEIVAEGGSRRVVGPPGPGRPALVA